MKHTSILLLFLIPLLCLTACSKPADKSLLAYEKALCRADSLSQSGAADSAFTAYMLSELHHKYEHVKELSGGKRVRMAPLDWRKEWFWRIFTGLMVGLNVWLSIKDIHFSGERKHRRYLVDLSENEERLRNNERERGELEACLAEMSLTDEERKEVNRSLTNLMAHGKQLYEENEAMRQRLKKYEKRPVPREMELLQEQDGRIRMLDEQVQTLAAKLVDNDELVQHLRTQPKFLSDADWENLRLLADRVYEGFYRRLTEHFPQLTSSDLQLCLLMRLRFSNAQIATLTAVSPSSVSQQKFRLKKRLLQTDDTLFQNGETVDMVICNC